MLGRLFLSGVVVGVYAAANFMFNVAAPVVAGDLAGLQMRDSNVAYGASAFARFFTGDGLPLIVVLATLTVIWWKPMRAWLAAAAVVVLCVSPVHAYWDSTDVTEAYTILPNESAFWIPDVGANKESQAHLESADYLRSNKIAAKRFTIPHTKLTGSTYLGWDKYVPAGRLVIVDRTPYSREWVHAENRGTSTQDQSFPCQSTEGLTIRIGMSVGASVTEDDSPTFLYRFGVRPPGGNRNDPQVIFTSVYYGRSLGDVMDDVGRKRVQTLVCDEIGKRTFDKANADMATIEHVVEDGARKWFAGVGITLDFLGWADTWEFDKEVQDAINRRYAAVQDAAAAQVLQPYATTIQQVAQAIALRSFADKFNGRLPNAVLLPPDVVSGLLGTTAVKLHVPAAQDAPGK